MVAVFCERRGEAWSRGQGEGQNVRVFFSMHGKLFSRHGGRRYLYNITVLYILFSAAYRGGRTAGIGRSGMYTYISLDVTPVGSSI